METKIFKCTQSTEHLKSKRKREALRIFVGIPIVILYGIWMLVRMIYTTANTPGLLPNGTDAVTWIPVIAMTIFTLLIVAIIIHVLRYCLQAPEMLRIKYDLIEGKVFMWEADSCQFVYKDKKRTLHFNAEDIRKWVSIKPLGTKNDIFLLASGEQIVLEGIFNPNINSFLHENKKMLKLPDPKTFTFVFNYYKNKV